MSTFGERLREERDRLGLNQTEFASLADSSKASQINYESGKRSPDSDYLAKIAVAGVDLLYLFTGLRSNHPALSAARAASGKLASIGVDLNSPMMVAARETSDRLAATGMLQSGGRYDEIPPALSPDDFVYIARYDVNLSAGPGLIPAENAEADQLAFSRAWMRREGLNNQSCGLLRVRGDSMAPTVQDGALVLVQMSDEPIAREGIYAYSREGAAFIKRMVPINTGKDGRATSFVILSDNPAYPPEVVVGEAMNEIRIVGRVRCAMTTF